MSGLLQLTGPVPDVIPVHLLQRFDAFCMIRETHKPITLGFVFLIIFHYSTFGVAWKLVERLCQDVFVHLHQTMLEVAAKNAYAWPHRFVQTEPGTDTSVLQLKEAASMIAIRLTHE